MVDVAALLADYDANELTVAQIATKHGFKNPSSVSHLAARNGRQRRWATGGRWIKHAPPVAFKPVHQREAADA
jgi:hypothetical protein